MSPIRILLALSTLYLCSFGVPVDTRYEVTDLEEFVTRPDIRPPKFNVTMYKEDALEPGYWFTAPYVDLKTRSPSSKFSPGQVGPHIYDNRGNLVYSGAHLIGERTAFDFRAVHINDSEYLSLIVDRDETQATFAAGAGLLFDSNFHLASSVQNHMGTRGMNMHEFNIVDDGRSALTITYVPQLFDYSYGKGQGPYGWIGNNGFQEVDLTTGKVTFSWWALDHVQPEDSMMQEPNGPGSGGVWDWFHMNSVDKNADGDYLISSRYTNAIYKLSGKDGHIIWQLGGNKSSFTQRGFRFSAQHDARFRRQNQTNTVISFLNNAANGHQRTSSSSAVLVVDLNTESMEASLFREYQRPDKELTKLRGNAQEMPNGNYFTCWSENSHISEHSPEGELLMEAQFSSKRLVTYRGGKFNFTGRPTWAPVSKGFVYGEGARSSTTTMYVSWNGATEVDKWRFWGSDQAMALNDFKILGDVSKEGFETMFMTSGFFPFFYAEAISSDGKSLGKSTITEIKIPKQWSTKGIPTASSVTPVPPPARFRPDHGLKPTEPTDKTPQKPATSAFDWPTNLMTSKQAAVVAIYLWVLTALYTMSHICFRRFWKSRRKEPWIKSQM